MGLFPSDGRMNIAIIKRIILIAAFLCFVLLALGYGVATINLLGLGLALWILTLIV